MKVPMDEKLISEFKALSDPLIEFLNSNFHPHVQVVIDPVSAELFESIVNHVTYPPTEGE
jgi:hypothetical protein